MSIPNIDVTVYPPGPSTTQRQMLYLTLAPADDALAPVYPVPLQLWIQNKQSTGIHLEKIEALGQGIATGLDIAAGTGAGWYATNTQYIILTAVPPSFTLKLYFTGYTDPWSDEVFLVPFTGSYRFPGKYQDLSAEEFWLGKGAAHAGGGDQLFHYDMGIVGWDDDMQQWRNVYPGKDGTHNEDHRIWNRPVYALADGVVTFYQNSVPENPAPGTVSPEGMKRGYGNAFNIQHGPYLATYMHMRPGSLNPALIQGYPEDVQFTNGATVKAGDFLGLAGNAGTSSAPHLHVGLVQRDPGRWQFSVPLPFSDVWAIQTSDLVAGDTVDAPWSKVTAQGLPWIPNGDGAVALGFPLKRRNISYEAAIDPLALLLGAHSDIYIRLTLPDPPPIDILIEQVRAQVKSMSAEQRRSALVRVEGLQKSLDAVAEVLAAAR